MTPADVARLRAELAEARQQRTNLEHRWAVARYTASSTDDTDALDVELARADATVAALEEALSNVGPALGAQTVVDTPPQESPAKGPGRHQDRLSGAGGYLPSSAPSRGVPNATPNTEPEYLTTREAATLLRTSTDTLERLRANGGGPPWKRVGRRILYPRATLLEITRK